MIHNTVITRCVRKYSWQRICLFLPFFSLTSIHTTTSLTQSTFYLCMLALLSLFKQSVDFCSFPHKIQQKYLLCLCFSFFVYRARKVLARCYYFFSFLQEGTFLVANISTIIWRKRTVCVHCVFCAWFFFIYFFVSLVRWTIYTSVSNMEHTIRSRVQMYVCLWAFVWDIANVLVCFSLGRCRCGCRRRCRCCLSVFFFFL